jgi:MarR family transcriptional regulator, organic hydroperoxide resistance regulator
MRPSADSELTWLLHRAAQSLRSATSEQAETHGLQLREYIILSALDLRPALTQIELGRALGLDKTTLMTGLDGLERQGLIVRRPDPHDRRARIPEITRAGSTVRAEVAKACAHAEAAALAGISNENARALRQMLVAIIGDDQVPGSCL